jgi:hypothetical protein
VTRTAADASTHDCPRATAACPATAGTAIAVTGPGLTVRLSGTDRALLLRHRSGVRRQPQPRPVRPLRRLIPLPGNAVTSAGWPADPGGDL